MGMYDYLGDYQIKIFNIPIYYGETYGVGYMGGQLRSYVKNEELPLQTLWYKYPQNFTVLDENAYNESNYIGMNVPQKVVHVIKDGKYFNTIPLKDFNDKYIGEKVYDYHGTLLNIHSKNDMYIHLKRKDELDKKRKELEKSYFPEGIFVCIKKDADKYDKLSPEYHDKLKLLNTEYSTKLYLPEEHDIEMTLGAYMDIVIDAFNEKDIEPDSFKDYKKSYEEIKKLTKDFINTIEESDINKFLDWVGDYCTLEHKELIKNFINKEIKGDA